MNFEGINAYVYGCGLAGRWAVDYLMLNGANILGFIDSDSKKADFEYSGIKVWSPKILSSNLECDLLVNSIVDIQDNNELLLELFGIKYMPLGHILSSIDISSTELSDSAEDSSLQYLHYSLDAVRSCHLNFLDKSTVYMRSIDIVVTERCSLKCKDCSNLMQYYGKPSNFSLEEIIKDIETLLSSVDFIYEFRVIGGEPFVNNKIYEILEYLCSFDKVNRASIFTNATIPLNEEKILSLPVKKLSFSITDYGDHSKQISNYKTILDANSISYRIHPPEYWTDSGTIIKPEHTLEEMKLRFSECCGKNLYTLMGDKIYRCPFAANLERVYPAAINCGNSVVVESHKSELNNYLYNVDFLPACNYCKGRSFSSPQIVPAIQTRNVITVDF